ncbi:MAG: ABC transporter permease [Defluviitaleaceae bacterium]|nr:ABC transporter permease [Defluviitaleaceae bacterium]
MNIFDLFSASFESIKANKMRAGFTMFGIVVGIMSVVMITSIGDGLSNTIDDQFADFGLDEITISHTSAVREIEWHERLNKSDAEFLRNHPEISHVTINSNTTFQNAIDQIGTTDMRAAQLQGVDEYRAFFSENSLIRGRNITYLDVLNRNHVAIIDQMAAFSIFGTEYVLGRTLEIRTNSGMRSFEIVGILEADDAMGLMEMFEMPFEIRVPITIVSDLSNSGNVVGNIRVRLYNRDNVQYIAPNLINLLELRKNAQDIFQTQSTAGMLEQIGDIVSLFTIFLTVVASISLLVGGIGVMNIMLVSVTERTREIGIKKSLGATNNTIQMQFLIEAATLTVLGGIIGIILGLSGGALIGMLVYLLLDLTLMPTVDLIMITIIVLISASVGLLFGVYPARKASLLDPVESLRFD